MKEDPKWRASKHLPHIDWSGLTQSVTFRLFDSLPRHLRSHDGEVGACILRDPAFAEVVEEVVLCLNGIQYNLHAWVIMPNHVHVLFTPIVGYFVAAIVKGWKSCSARRINALRGTSGSVWSRDYFDRYIRDAAHFDEVLWYIELNPVRAGLVIRKEDWRYSSAYGG